MPTDGSRSPSIMSDGRSIMTERPHSKVASDFAQTQRGCSGGGHSYFLTSSLAGLFGELAELSSDTGHSTARAVADARRRGRENGRERQLWLLLGSCRVVWGRGVHSFTFCSPSARFPRGKPTCSVELNSTVCYIEEPKSESDPVRARACHGHAARARHGPHAESESSLDVVSDTDRMI